jgi:tetratricopeptide (TPR) repeat protein
MDVHAPHEPVHNWKEYFTHISIIVIGLIIATCMEQGVVWLEHRHQVSETRKLLKEEREANIQAYYHDVQLLYRKEANLKVNLRVFQFMQQHPGTPEEKLPGILSWGGTDSPVVEAAWLSAKQDNVLALMPRDEVEESRQLYVWLERQETDEDAYFEAMVKAGKYRYTTPDISKLSPEQIDAVIAEISECIHRWSLLAVDLDNIDKIFYDFQPGPTEADMSAFLPPFAKEDIKGRLAAAAAEETPYYDAGDASADQLKIKAEVYTDLREKLRATGELHVEQALAETDTDHPGFKPEEVYINSAGYVLMNQEKLPEAIAFLKLNVKLYPDSYNVYDSLGEAYMKAGKKKLAIENYQISLQKKPDSKSGKEALEKLGAKPLAAK